MNATNNLSRKEYRDAREIFIGGVAVFLVVPITLEWLFYFIGGDGQTEPFVAAFLGVAGWLYAVISGAHTVCRDWGRAEESFLLALPVSPRQVVWAKLKTGAIILFGVLLLAGAWELSMKYCHRFGYDTEGWIETFRTAILWACLFAVAYVIAFVAAVVTRQMLTSTLVGCLVMLIWYAGPMISSRLEILRPGWWAPIGLARPSIDAPWLGFGWSFVALIALGLVGCVGVALISCTRERVIRLGHKQLAWIVALVVLTLLGLALGEVGNSLVVRDQKEIFRQHGDWYLGKVLASRGDRYYVVSVASFHTPDNRKPESTFRRLQFASFRLDERGRLQDLREADLPDKFPGWGGIIGFAADENGELVMDTYGEEGGTSLVRLRLQWTNDGRLHITSRTRIKPPGYYPTANVYRTWDDSDWETNVSRYAYMQEWLQGEHSLCVFDWSDGPNPRPRYEIKLPPFHMARISGGKLRIGLFRQPTNGVPWFWAPGKPIDPEHPELLLDKSNWVRDPRDLPPQEFINELDTGQGDNSGDLWCVGTLRGMRLLRHPRPGEWDLLGEYRESPLALWFRHFNGNHYPRFMDDSLIVEISGSLLNLYSFSDPAHPRRVGFFQTYAGDVYPTPHFLLLMEGNLITVLDRPRS